ncbi:hypothetical protein ICY_02064 [Bacillus cereus BAG2X1-3]|nr:hypothetical protein ICY_02064 [Bacillus cereus BAG2X1-3]
MNEIVFIQRKNVIFLWKYTGRMTFSMNISIQNEISVQIFPHFYI